MTLDLKAFLSLNTETKQLGFYYFLYCLIFVLTHLMLISVFSFFHFLLEHEMGTIENWISRNTWEILAIAKLIACWGLIRITQLNYYGDKKIWDYFKEMKLKPTKKSLAFAAFVLVVFYSLIVQFGGGIKSNQFLDDLFLSSYLGSSIFYGVDIFCLLYLQRFFNFKQNSLYRWSFILLILFLISSKIVLPYLSKYFIFLIVHFLFLYYLGNKRLVGDMLVYLLLLVGPLSSLLGMDLVWDNSYAIFTYNEKVPVLGIISIWCVGLGYYRFSRLD